MGALTRTLDPEVTDSEQEAIDYDAMVASIHAALTVSEVRAMIEPLGIPGSAVGMASDRHWTLAQVRP